MKVKAILIIICLVTLNCADLNNSSNDKTNRKHLSMSEIKENLKEDLRVSLKNVSRSNLIKMALATEEYDREVNDQTNLMGGLHDYIMNLSDEEIISKIKEVTSQHQEINNLEKLNKLSSGFTSDRLSLERERISREYFSKLSLEMIKNCALGVEKYYKSKETVHTYGGLHDYINSLSKKELTEYVMMEQNNHPEILTNFHELCATKISTLNNSLKFNSIVNLLDINVMRAYAMTLLVYNNQKNNETIESLDDHVKNLDKNQLIDCILMMLKRLPEMNSLSKMEEMRRNLNIEIKNE